MSEPFEVTLTQGLDEVRKDLKLLLGQEVEHGPLHVEWAASDEADPRAPLEVDILVEPKPSGHLRLRLESRVGVLLSGLLRLLDAPTLARRVSAGLLEADDEAALVEIGTQIAGSLNTGLARGQPDPSFHVRRGEVRVSGTPGPALLERPVLRVRQPFTIPGHPEGAFHLTFDASAARTILDAEPPPAAKEAAAPTARAPWRTPPEPGRADSVLVLYETRSEGARTAEVIRAVTGCPVLLQRLDGSARRRLLEGRIATVVIDTAERKERALTACRRLACLVLGAEIPVILCAPSWRREEVQRAVRAGASGILVKPLEPERVRAALGACAGVD